MAAVLGTVASWDDCDLVQVRGRNTTGRSIPSSITSTKLQRGTIQASHGALAYLGLIDNAWAAKMTEDEGALYIATLYYCRISRRPLPLRRRPSKYANCEVADQ